MKCPADLVTFTEEILNGRLHFLQRKPQYKTRTKRKCFHYGQSEMLTQQLYI